MRLRGIPVPFPSRRLQPGRPPHGWNGNQLAEQLHIDPSTVSRALKLLRLDEATQKAVEAGQVVPTVAIKA
ncbi:MAG: hypothetical protein L0Z62_41120 [Gemmataceae bacterium]|nr:hypothetical protein [Gemmataceae bacterium]